MPGEAIFLKLPNHQVGNSSTAKQIDEGTEAYFRLSFGATSPGAAILVTARLRERPPINFAVLEQKILDRNAGQIAGFGTAIAHTRPLRTPLKRSQSTLEYFALSNVETSWRAASCRRFAFARSSDVRAPRSEFNGAGAVSR